MPTYIGTKKNDEPWVVVHTIPDPVPPVEEIIVTPANYKSLLKNIDDANFTGSTAQYVQVTGTAESKYGVRLELPCNWENVEISAKIKIVKIGTNQNYLIQQYGRGGHHGNVVTVPMPDNTGGCMGCCYKGRFLNTTSTFVKEINHPAYTANRAANPISHTALLGRWAEIKTTIMNAPNSYVILQNYVDNRVVSEAVDGGDWSTTDSDYLANCPAREFGNTGYRKRNERLNKPGVLVAWRADGGTVFQFEWLKVRKL
jgi:hypothetical protein